MKKLIKKKTLRERVSSQFSIRRYWKPDWRNSLVIQLEI